MIQGGLWILEYNGHLNENGGFRLVYEFIKQHRIVDIGHKLPGELVSEIILDLPFEFIDIVKKSNYYISRISWWERASIHAGSILGLGGPRDPRDPEEFFFSETGICRDFSVTASKTDYCNYIGSIISQYQNLNLFPAFELQHRKTLFFRFNFPVEFPFSQ